MSAVSSRRRPNLRKLPKRKKTSPRLAEDLEQEKQDNEVEPDKKKAALKAIIADYKRERFRRQSFRRRVRCLPLSGCPEAHQGSANIPTPTYRSKVREKIDITIVVDMLLTGFDSKYPEHALRG